VRGREGAAEQRPIRRARGHGPPEIGEPLTRALAPAGAQTVRERDRVHRTGAGAADALDLDRLLFQEPVEHTPRERAM
jgi:hypothetical protein